MKGLQRFKKSLSLEALLRDNSTIDCKATSFGVAFFYNDSTIVSNLIPREPLIRIKAFCIELD